VGAEPCRRQVEVASAPDQMREILQQHLRPLGGRIYEVQGCEVSFVRRRWDPPSVSLQCTVRLREPDTGQEWSRVVTGVMYGGNQTRPIWEDLRQQDLSWAISDADPALAPVSYVPELDMLVQVFPYDHRLPALARLTAGPPPELVPLLLAQFGPGDWWVEGWVTETVRYRVDRRACVKWTGRARDSATGRPEERRFYSKVYSEDSKGEQVHRSLRALWDRARAGGAGFTVARPLTYLPDHRTLVEDELVGTSLNKILRRKDDAIPAVRKVARAVASLHLSDVVAPHRPLQDEVTWLERSGDVLRAACPQLGPELEATVAAVVAGLDEVPPVPTHGDLKPVHILLHGDQVGFLDLEQFVGGDPVLDVANFVVQLVRDPFGSRLPGGRPGTLARAFVEEYFARAPSAWRARFPRRYAMAILMKAASVYRGQNRIGFDGAGAYLETARDALAGRVW
jgi:hypothetical protein